MAIEQKAFRLYPNNYTPETLPALNKLLGEGWLVKMSLQEVEVIASGRSDTKHVLILEREKKDE
jgi:hypothetical protein